MDAAEKTQTYKSLYLSPIIAGGVAGVTVVTAIYPLDTLKTRLQAAQGFKKAGGFRGVYKGLLTLATGSAPMNSLFFVSYEATKSFCEPLVAPQYVPVVHMFAASFCEVLACLIRVPTEIVKQRKQTYVGTKSKSALSILANAYKTEGIRRGVYRGFSSTVLRDLPFSFIELPTWELLKTMVREHNNGEITSFQSGICGSIAGGFAAGVTTPLDLAKTRIMLADTLSDNKLHKLRISSVLADIYVSAGVRGLFAGITPRISMVMIGGFFFFGMYEETKRVFEEYVGER
ncbi:S-adenosylmethionine mitochondrial carrier protein homolog [Anticarsia gemmatalis]|uniref:S-adenosylmethionine mitochondrial carrier protein homolog n=1 Tax=Anticarsia gemmatalis TaxID=129554 RepID=UPI003F75B345